MANPVSNSADATPKDPAYARADFNLQAQLVASYVPFVDNMGENNAFPTFDSSFSTRVHLLKIPDLADLKEYPDGRFTDVSLFGQLTGGCHSTLDISPSLVPDEVPYPSGRNDPNNIYTKVFNDNNEKCQIAAKNAYVTVRLNAGVDRKLKEQYGLSSFIVLPSSGFKLDAGRLHGDDNWGLRGIRSQMPVFHSGFFDQDPAGSFVKEGWAARASYGWYGVFSGMPFLGAEVSTMNGDTQDFGFNSKEYWRAGVTTVLDLGGFTVQVAVNYSDDETAASPASSSPFPPASSSPSPSTTTTPFTYTQYPKVLAGYVYSPLPFISPGKWDVAASAAHQTYAGKDSLAWNGIESSQAFAVRGEFSSFFDLFETQFGIVAGVAHVIREDRNTIAEDEAVEANVVWHVPAFLNDDKTPVLSFTVGVLDTWGTIQQNSNQKVVPHQQFFPTGGLFFNWNL